MHRCLIIPLFDIWVNTAQKSVTFKVIQLAENSGIRTLNITIRTCWSRFLIMVGAVEKRLYIFICSGVPDKLLKIFWYFFLELLSLISIGDYFSAVWDKEKAHYKNWTCHCSFTYFSIFSAPKIYWIGVVVDINFSSC